MNSKVYFVENLTLRAWVLSMWPRLVWERLRTGTRAVSCNVILGSQTAMTFAKASGRLFGISVQRLDFRVMDIRGDDGLFMHMRIQHEDLINVQRYAMEEPSFQAVAQYRPELQRLSTFLAKQLVISPRFDGRSFAIWDALYLIEVCSYKSKQDGTKGRLPILFLEPRPWINAISRFASERGVSVVLTPGAPDVGASVRRLMPPIIVSLVRALRYRNARRHLLASFRRKAAFRTKPEGLRPSAAPVLENEDGLQERSARLAVPYHGHLSLDNPERHSDLFFWQQSELPGRKVVVGFSNPGGPLDQDKLSQLQRHQIGVSVLHPAATTVSNVPIDAARPTPIRSREVAKMTRGLGMEGRWLRQQVATYNGMRAYWSRYFESQNIKVFTSWWKNDATHCAIADALQDLGGITTIYQRSYEAHPAPQLTIDADIVFGFSPMVANVERNSNSNIRYHVATGYLGDHRFDLLRAKAADMRGSLLSKGASHIMAFTDENTVDDTRWYIGHELAREEYQFLFDKVLTETWFGLLIKPKMPRTLRRRLGPDVTELLESAVATGRCHVYEAADDTQASHPPCEAALAADIAVHGHLLSGAAALEAVLAGTPTLLLDREGWDRSPFYRLGVGRVVFHGFEPLWQALREHWTQSEGVPGFGDWSLLLDELDPFRDGRAAERMGTYLNWLLQGFQAGLDRETIMSDAAERYCAAWGSDKITEVGSQPGLPKSQSLVSRSSL